MTMKCYVGMTTKPARRKKEHQANYGTLYSWSVEGPFPSRILAQKREDELATLLKCRASPGGRDVFGLHWYVYSFKYKE